MGQLERYGLYVLCLVIFLILGVAIWGGDPQVPENGASGGSPIRADAGSAGEPAPDADQQAPRGPRDDFFAPDGFEPREDARGSVLAGMRRAQDGGAPRAGIGGQPSSDDPPRPHSPLSPDSARERSYTVQAGESMAKIAQRELGSQRYTDAIVKLNPAVDPRKMKPGTVLRLPSRAALSARASRDGGSAAPAEGRTPMKYKVRNGDSPASIAKRFYGKDTQALANKIMKANGIRDARRLRAGKWIVIPPADS